MSEENKASLRRVIDEIWNKGNMSVVDELIGSDVVNRDPSNPSDVVGVDEYKKLVTTYRDAFPDLTFTGRKAKSTSSSAATRT